MISCQIATTHDNTTNISDRMAQWHAMPNSRESFRRTSAYAVICRFAGDYFYDRDALTTLTE